MFNKYSIILYCDELLFNILLISFIYQFSTKCKSNFLKFLSQNVITHFVRYRHRSP